jgi:hypothetical protein
LTWWWWCFLRQLHMSRLIFLCELVLETWWVAFRLAAVLLCLCDTKLLTDLLRVKSFFNFFVTFFLAYHFAMALASWPWE